MNMLKLIGVGDVIHGYCNGYFGRDSYGDKVCVMCTPAYAVFEDCETRYASVLNYEDGLENSVKDWLKETED